MGLRPCGNRSLIPVSWSLASSGCEKSASWGPVLPNVVRLEFVMIANLISSHKDLVLLCSVLGGSG